MTTDCKQCGQEMDSNLTYFCTVCCHNGIDDDLREEHGFLQRERPKEPEFEYADEPPAEAQQSGLGDFMGTEAMSR